MGSASDTDALQLSGFVLSRAYHAFRNPDDHDDRNHPRREERNRHADHAQAPHDCPGALRKRASQCGERAALV